jgi:hypothetical protein
MAIDIALIVLGGIFTIAGVIGCILPIIPGPPLSYVGLLLLQLSSEHPFTVQFLVIYAILTVLVVVLDYIIPIYGTKKLEGSKYGMWGSAVGLIIGLMFFFPFGIIIGPMLGAFIGELLMGGKTKDKALKSVFGSFLGFLVGTTIKFILSLSMVYYFVMAVYNLYIS